MRLYSLLLHGHILILDLSDYFLDFIPLNMVALVVLCGNWPSADVTDCVTYVPSKILILTVPSIYHRRWCGTV